MSTQPPSADAKLEDEMGMKSLVWILENYGDCHLELCGYNKYVLYWRLAKRDDYCRLKIGIGGDRDNIYRYDFNQYGKLNDFVLRFGHDCIHDVVLNGELIYSRED